MTFACIVRYLDPEGDQVVGCLIDVDVNQILESRQGQMRRREHDGDAG